MYITGATFADSLCANNNFLVDIDSCKPPALTMPPPKVLIFFLETEQTYSVLVHGDQDVNSIGDFEWYVTQDDSFDDPNKSPFRI
jgi:hypothetical protein